MAFKSLEELRAAYKSNNDNSNDNRPNNYYPFWNMQIGEQATVRFLPDANEENPLGFMAEKIMHNLVINGKKKSVPCLSMYGQDDCPVCKVSQAYYKQEDKKNGSKYWKKKQHLAQVIVVSDPLEADKDTGETHEGKVRYLSIGFQLFNVIMEAFDAGDLDERPDDYKNGTDFIIKKTKPGEYESYQIGSKFARKERALDDDTIASLDLIDLSTLLPKNPGIEKIEAMLDADLSGADYDDSSTTTSTPVASTNSNLTESSVVAKVEAAVSAASDPVVEEQTGGALEDKAQGILAEIQARRAAEALAKT